MISDRVTRMMAAVTVVISATYFASVLVLSVFNPPITQAAGWTAYASIVSMSYGTDDEWYNYDFGGQNAATNNVDWPVRYFFYDDADINKVKDTADGCNNDPFIFPCLNNSGGPKDFRGKEGGSWYWDDDSGIKLDANCELDQHMRVYSKEPADSNFDANTFGYYILGTVHKDLEGSGCDDVYYSAEGEEGWWNSRFSGISGWAVSADDTHYYNYEPARWGDANHWVQSNGYATYVGVP